MKRILFICLGNICRSSAAEEILRTKARQRGLNIEVDSAGLIDYHQGELSDPRMRQHASARGYRLIHRSRPVQTEDFRNFDIIICMDEKNEQRLHRLAPEAEGEAKIRRATDFIYHYDADSVPDPYYGGDADFEYALDLLEDCADGIIDELLSD